MSLAFMRGRTFKHAFIIADEMQNSSPNQMKMLTTRLGENSRMVITGDLEQTDIIKENGLYDIVNRIERKKDPTYLIKIIRLNKDDIERSDIVKKIIELYDNKREDKIINQQNTNITDKNNSTIVDKKYKYSGNDAALIPLQHISQNHDIFYYKIDF